MVKLTLIGIPTPCRSFNEDEGFDLANPVGNIITILVVKNYFVPWVIPSRNIHP